MGRLRREMAGREAVAAMMVCIRVPCVEMEGGSGWVDVEWMHDTMNGLVVWICYA